MPLVDGRAWGLQSSAIKLPFVATTPEKLPDKTEISASEVDLTVLYRSVLLSLLLLLLLLLLLPYQKLCKDRPHTLLVSYF